MVYLSKRYTLGFYIFWVGMGLLEWGFEMGFEMGFGMGFGMSD